MNIREAKHADAEVIVQELLLPFYKLDEKLDPLFNELDEEALENLVVALR